MIENIQVVGLVALYAVVELSKYAIDKTSTKKSSLSTDESFRLESLYDMHNVKDGDGRPMWYVPPSLSETQKQILGICEKISNHQERTARHLKEISRQVK